MNSLLKRFILFLMFLMNISTLFWDWQVIAGLTSRGGLMVLTQNIMLGGIIICLYIMSLLLYKKAKTICFITGLCSLSMLAALEFSKFEAYGRFNNSAIGVYLGLATIITNIVLYIILLKKETFHKEK